MWIFSSQGFVSVVDKPNEATPSHCGMHIRARDRGVLDWIAAHIPGTQVLKSFPGSDYQWRMIIQKKAKFAEVVALLMNSIDYNNFKAAANKDAYADGVLMDVYHAATRTLSNGGQTGFQFDSDFHHQDK